MQNNADRSLSYKDLSEDRFASHVIQTLLVLGGGETVEREVSVLHTLIISLTDCLMIRDEASWRRLPCSAVLLAPRKMVNYPP